MFINSDDQFNYLFNTKRNNNILEFDRKQLGTVENDSEGDSGFTLTVTTEGAERIEAIHCMVYNSDCEIIDIYKL